MPIRKTLLALAVSSSLGGCADNTSDTKLRGTLDIDVSVTHTASAVQEIIGINELTSTSQPIGQYELCRNRRNGYELMCKEGYDSISIGNYQQLFPIVKKVFNTGKRKVSPNEDIKIYEVEEMWIYPTQKGETYIGDCEDFVIFWMSELKKEGISDYSLRPMVVQQKDGNGHLILGVLVKEGILILDNLQNQPIFIQNISDIQGKIGYTFRKMVGNQSQVSWVR